MKREEVALQIYLRLIRAEVPATSREGAMRSAFEAADQFLAIAEEPAKASAAALTSK